MSTNNNWLELSINTTTIVGELLSEFLLESGAKGVVLGEWDPESLSEYTKIKGYFPEDIDNIEEIIRDVEEKLAFYKESELNTGAEEILTKLVKEEDWANSWKQYFHVLHIGKSLVIKPLWEEYEKKEHELVINIDPGMAFGTGTHPSTQLCMERLEELFLDSTINKDYYNMLDLGTGSGVLSITLSLLGFKNITAVDIDQVAIKASKENFDLNNLEINLFKGELKDCKEQYDFIAGNILAEVIISLAEGISEKLKPNGKFMGSGIIRRKETDVIEALTKAGLKFESKRYQDDWVLVNFTK